MNAEVLRIVEESVQRIFGDHLEAVIRRDGDGFDHRSMNSVGKRFAIFRRGALTKRNANERHDWVSSVLRCREVKARYRVKSGHHPARSLWPARFPRPS